MKPNFSPFIIIDEIPEPYFCDREKETENFMHLIANGHNIVLLSPRRMGKSSLVEHCYRQPQIKENYYTFYLDILPTSSLAEMVYLLSKKIYDQLLHGAKRLLITLLDSSNLYKEYLDMMPSQECLLLASPQE